ncbi:MULTISPECIES: transcription antitermination factor NusB [unclassified Treponema]|uniref:transcription antitermination factor NusB n=1 Tax=unclassified Treponema TaxID=2638727 RepID=UPI0020A34D75|nr:MULTISPECIES: transcription antitermination factor NusB [unclassified Treponema]UTC68001.1 transcription antitermination factor NusB [Treponema sp. OMZ 789]UTC70723.1 transcription antitermination factor NusB [Treponema sp. OMZ 790]UTC73443.1 transcription antitermination factor NusB [Treponema sp. OMZ 791]
MSIGRRRGRILAFQALAAWDMGGAVLDDLLTFSWQKEQSESEESSDKYIFPKMMLLGTIENITEIDKAIQENLDNWVIERLNSVDKAILRLSVYSLLYQKDTPAPIVIDEAINLAKDFGTDDSYKFVNAVLDSIKNKS